MTSRRRFATFLRLETFSLPVVFIILVLVFSFLRPDTFPTVKNEEAILGNQAVTAMVALAVMIPLVVGEFDLSLASLSGWASMEFAALMAKDHIGVVLSLIIALATGALIGGINAFVVLRLHVNSFIATLGMGTLLTGLSLWITGGAPVYTGIPASISNFGGDTALGIPAVAWLVLAFGLFLWITLRHFPLGRRMYAVGSNQLAARFAGVHTSKIAAGSFIIAGALAASAGIMSVAYTGSASPTTGPSLLLPAFAAVFLGSTTVEVGRFNVVGTLLGVLLVAVGVAGLEQLGLASYIENLFDGGILILAVAGSVGVGRMKDHNRAALALIDDVDTSETSGVGSADTANL